MIQIYFDGLCEPYNPRGHAAWGIVIKENNYTILKRNGYLGSGENITNNFAEYTALIQGLKKVLHILKDPTINIQNTKIQILGDSQLVINQMCKIYKVKSPNIIPLFKRAQMLTQEISKITNNISFLWIPREQNKEADYQSRLGLFERPDMKEKIDYVIQNYKFITKNEKNFQAEVITPEKKKYIIKQDSKKILSCNCPYFQREKIPCKHSIAALTLFYEKIIKNQFPTNYL